MIVGIGVDIVTVARIADAVSSFNEKFLCRCFTQGEISKCQRIADNNFRMSHLTARFAAKEAVMKALGTGLKGFKFTDIEIVNLESGQPSIILHNEAKIVADELKISNIHISISHESDKAIAFVIAESVFV